MNKFTQLLILPMILGWAGFTHATTTLVVSGGILMGASEVSFMGSNYDVEFVNESCTVAYSGCDDAEDFIFTTVIMAAGFGDALLATVFQDGPLGNFDTDPTLTFGCEQGASGYCTAVIPYALDPLARIVGVVNDVLEPEDVAPTGLSRINPNSPMSVNTTMAVISLSPNQPLANINMVATEGSGDVVITATGSIDLTGLTLTGTVDLTGTVSPNTGEVWVGASQGTTYAGFSPAPAPFGSGSSTQIPPGGGGGVLIGIRGGDLVVPFEYVSNAQLGPITSTYFGESFASLGMDVGLNIYTLTNGQTVSLDVSDDADSDGVIDDQDNCILVANPTQCDGDGDNYGNHCDADFNDDLVVNGLDIGPMKAGFGSADAVVDLNCDGIVDGLDIGPLKAMFGSPPGPSGLVP